MQEVEAGYITGGTHPMMESSQVIPMDDHMFDNDSTCMGGLTSKTLCLVEKDTGRRISFDIEGYPYTLIWSTPGNPKLHFLCVEPWHSLPDRADASGVWARNPAPRPWPPARSGTPPWPSPSSAESENTKRRARCARARPFHPLNKEAFYVHCL